MDALLGSKSIPPGFRFHPTDEELFMFYLKRKVIGKSLGPQMMSEVDVFQFAPWELPTKACLKTRDLNWYFICPRSKKYPNQGRSNRATVHGYWKSTGADRTVNYKNRPVGKIKTLIFYRGKAPKGDRTDWVMHEYRLDDSQLLQQGVAQDSYVICKVYEKSGPGPKNGENYGAPFVEEEWDSDDDDNVGNVENVEPDSGPSIPVNVGHNPDGSAVTSTPVCQEHVGPLTPSAVQQPLPPLIESGEDEIDRLLAAFIEGDDSQILESDIFNGLEDLGGGNPTCGMEFDWSTLLSDDCYLELKDLHD
ncbi:NAC domain-containing protein 17-like [Silene latifolia]|uniref:NAC domain-containing protein 17-like n=1 Tax=Silene latifolia TaxID=37657 RepID=UPI003D78083A